MNEAQQETYTLDLDAMQQRIATLEQQVQQIGQYPRLGVNMEEGGAVLVIALGPANVITQSVPEQTMNDLCGRWLETRKDIKKQLQIVKGGKQKR